MAEQFFQGKSSITLKKELGKLPLSHWMLYFPFRDYVINKVKAPLQRAIEGAKTFKEIIPTLIESARKLPKFNRDNLDHPNAKLISDILDKVVEYHNNPSRNELIRQACKLIKAEYAHDDYYAFFLDYVAVEIAIEILTGNYKPKNHKHPFPKCWTGPEIPTNEEILNRVREVICQKSQA
jgi:hypothetical protein